MKRNASIDLREDCGVGKKDREIETVRQILQRLGFSEYEITSHERPDALVDFKDRNGHLRLGCEIQTLQSDSGTSGSELRTFYSRWIQIMEEVIKRLSSENLVVPYCCVQFKNPSYSCLKNAKNSELIEEFVKAGRQLCTVSKLGFPRCDLPKLSSILSNIWVVENHRLSLLWWPTHLRSGEVVELDATVIEAVDKKSRLAANFDWNSSDIKTLLLVAEARGSTDIVGYARPFELPSPRKLPFDWVLIWDKFSEDIWTIYPRYSVICNGLESFRRPDLLPSELRRFCTGGKVYPTRIRTQ